jgi:Mce-associated membrane protein
MTTPESGSADTTIDKTDDPAKETTTVPVDTEENTTGPTEATETADTTQAPETAGSTETAGAAETTEAAAGTTDAEQAPPKRRFNVKRALILGVLPVVALLLALAAGYLKWQDSSVRDAELASIESVQVAKDSTIALLSYRPDTVDKDLGAARDLLTGDFKNSYTSLTNDVVIPGAKQKQISAVATVPAVASVSADANHAVALVFVNQTVIVGQDAPTDTASSVKVTMEKINGHWLISGFDPV